MLSSNFTYENQTFVYLALNPWWKVSLVGVPSPLLERAADLETDLLLLAVHTIAVDIICPLWLTSLHCPMPAQNKTKQNRVCLHGHQHEVWYGWIYGRSGKKRENTASEVVCSLTISCMKKQSYWKYIGMEEDPCRRRKHCLKAVEWGRHTNLWALGWGYNWCLNPEGRSLSRVLSQQQLKGRETKCLLVSLKGFAGPCLLIIRVKPAPLPPQESISLSPRNWGKINVIQPWLICSGSLMKCSHIC